MRLPLERGLGGFVKIYCAPPERIMLEFNSVSINILPLWGKKHFFTYADLWGSGLIMLLRKSTPQNCGAATCILNENFAWSTLCSSGAIC
jgi:hypothetical protein